jgi:hypothetical protein
MIFQTYLKRVPAVATQKQATMRAAIRRYLGVTLGESYVERDFSFDTENDGPISGAIRRLNPIPSW